MDGSQLTTVFMAVLGALVPVAVSVGALYKYIAHRERQSIVRSAFREVVDALGAQDPVHRRAGAIMLRRFFDERTEQGGKGTPYAKEALNVIAATLRNLETGSFQKLLADGLAYAPTLREADLQKTNLQGAYLGAHSPGQVDLSGADFFRADLTSASLKNADARSAVFFQARLNNTVFRGADLRDANFYEADLKGARFNSASLEGAVFSNARNVPDELRDNLDEEGRYRTAGANTKWIEPPNDKIFLSRPGAANMETRQLLWALSDRICDQGFSVVEIRPDEYSSTGAVAEVRRVMSGCAGVVVVAVPDLHIHAAAWRVATPQARDVSEQGMTSPWTNLELGVAVGLGLPVLLAKAEGISPDSFDFAPHEPNFFRVMLEEDHQSRAFREHFDDWCGSVRER